MRKASSRCSLGNTLNGINESQDCLKIVIIGDHAVGKSSLMFKYTDDSFNDFLTGTTGIDLKRKNVKIEDVEYKVLIYDTPGHDRYRQFAKSQIKSMDGIIVVFDVTERSSYNNTSTWLKSIHENSQEGAVVIIVGNKIDLESMRQVSSEEGFQITNINKLKYFETSAYSGKGVDSAFDFIVGEAANNRKHKKHLSESKTENFNDRPPKKKSSCVCN